MMLGFFLAIVTLVVLPPALGNLLAKGDFGAAFRFKEWWPVFKANLSGYILAVALGLGVFYLLYTLAFLLYATLVLACLLPFAFAFMLFIGGIVIFSLYAIAYRDSLRNQVTPAPAA